MLYISIHLNKSKIEDDENIDVFELLFRVFVDVGEVIIDAVVVDGVLFVVETKLLLFVRFVNRAALIDIADIAAAAIFAEACAFVVTNDLGLVLLDIVCELDTVVVGCDVVAVTVINWDERLVEVLFIFCIELFDWFLAN